MNFKKWILPILLVVIVGGYFAYRQFFNAPTPVAIVNPTPNPTPTPSPTGAQSGYKDGQYTGQVANTVYGDVQVTAIINGGKLTDIQIVKAPSSPGHTSELTTQVMPLLKTEAIQSQSANVNVISGATQTSEGFSQSLANALSMAS